MCEKGELESMMCRWTSDFEADPPTSNTRPKFVKISRQATRPRKPRPASSDVGPLAIRDLGPEGKARIAALIRELAIVSGQRAEFEAKLVAAQGEKSSLIMRRAELEAELETLKAEKQRQGARIFTEKIDAELLLRTLKQENENEVARHECDRCNSMQQDSARDDSVRHACDGRHEKHHDCLGCSTIHQESTRCNTMRHFCRRCETNHEGCLRCKATRQPSAKRDTMRQEYPRHDVTIPDPVNCNNSKCNTGRLETSFRCFESQPRASVASPLSHVTSTPRVGSPKEMESERLLLERERQLLEREKRCLEAELAARIRVQEAEKPLSSRCQPVRSFSPHSLHSFVLRPGLLNAKPETVSDDASLAESVTLALADTEPETIATSPRPRDRYMRRPGRQPPSPPSSLLDVIDSLSGESPRGFDVEPVEDDENRLLEDLFFVRLL